MTNHEEPVRALKGKAYRMTKFAEATCILTVIVR